MSTELTLGQGPRIRHPKEGCEMTEADSFCRVITCDRPRDVGEYCSAHKPAEAEAKAIEFDGASGLCSAHQEPCHQCYSHLKSRLLAVEAELGKLKAELARLADSWLKNAANLRLEAARYETYENLEACASELLAAGIAATPSPPVAPEPAQEAGGVERIAARSARHALVSLYEVVGDHGEHFKRLHAFVDQQEQSSREMMALADELNAASEDRDAERTQKEEAKKELKNYSRWLADRIDRRKP